MQCLGMAIFAESLAMITRVERPLESDISAGYPWGNQVAAVGRECLFDLDRSGRYKRASCLC